MGILALYLAVDMSYLDYGMEAESRLKIKLTLDSVMLKKKVRSFLSP